MSITPTGDDSWKNIKFDPSFGQGCGLAWASNTTITMAAGNWRDQSAQWQITLASQVTINAAQAAVVNGLDSGSLANSTWYYVYLIGDSLNKKPAGGLLSTSATAPVLPAGYDMFRMVGAVLTDGSAHILKFYQANRYFQFDAPISVLAAGTATAYTAIDLSVAVPPVNFGRVWLYSALTPAAAGHTAKFQPQGATGDFHIQTGQVATVAVDQQFNILPLLASSKPEVAYKLTANTDALSVSVEGFEMIL